MALAETAHLITELSLRDQLSPGLSRATGALNGMQSATKLAGRGLTGLGSTLSGGVSSALSTFKGRIGSIISGPLGLLGLGAAAFSVGHLMGESVQQAKDFGAEVLRLSALTGLDATKTSELAAAFEHYGISIDDSQRAAGLAEKNIFRLGGTTKAAKDFFDKYGFSLVTSTGQLKDFNTVLLDSADFFNNAHIPAAQKDAALAAIYGRGWQSLIPILAAGRDQIAGVEEEAQKLGLTLTTQNLQDLIRLRDSTRDWTTALGGLKLQIGLALVPTLTDLTTAATTFLANGGRDRIVGFFKNLIAFGQQAGDTVTRDVIPIFKGIYGAWQAVPPELRDLIIKGFAADRTIKFLFGFSPASLVVGGLGQLLGRGSSPVNPMWVQSVGGVGGGGVAGGVGGGILGGITKFLGLTTAVGLGAILGNEIGHAVFFDPTIKPAVTFEKSQFAQLVTATDLTKTELDQKIGSLDTNIAYLAGPDWASQLLSGFLMGDQIQLLRDQRDALIAIRDALGTTTESPLPGPGRLKHYPKGTSEADVQVMEEKRRRATVPDAWNTGAATLPNTAMALPGQKDMSYLLPVLSHIPDKIDTSNRYLSHQQSILDRIEGKPTNFTVTIPVTVNLNASLLQSKIFQLRKAAALTKAGIF